MFADVLTQLLEDIAGVIERYSSIVDSCYGTNWTRHLIQKLQVLWYIMVTLLCNSLPDFSPQDECDLQVAKVLTLQAEERSLDNKVSNMV